MKLHFRNPISEDLDRIIEIENTGFTPEEAATREAMAERIKLINDTFLLVENEKGAVLGYVVGPIISERHLHDELFDTTIKNPPYGGYQSILSLVVDPRYHGNKIASKLLKQLAILAKENEREGMTLTCLKELIPFYKKNGYVNEGVSDSQHANLMWFNLVRDFNR